MLWVSVSQNKYFCKDVGLKLLNGILLFAVLMDEVIHFSHAPSEGRVEVILYAIVSPALKVGGNFGPLVAQLAVILEEDLVLRWGPLPAVIELGG